MPESLITIYAYIVYDMPNVTNHSGKIMLCTISALIGKCRVVTTAKQCHVVQEVLDRLERFPVTAS